MINNNIEELFFNVEEQKLFHGDEETKFKKIINKDTNKIISVVSNDYLLIPNKLIINSVQDYFGGTIKPIYTASNGGFSVAKLQTERLKEVSVGDTVAAVVSFENSYDGSRALSINVEALRLRCMNGMVSSVNVFSARTKHIGDKNPQEIVDNMLDSLDKFDGMFDSLVSTFAKMRKVNFTKAVKIEFIKYLSNFPTYVSDLIVQQIIKDDPKTVWDLYNSITYVCTHLMKKSFKGLEMEKELNNFVYSI